MAQAKLGFTIWLVLYDRCTKEQYVLYTYMLSLILCHTFVSKVWLDTLTMNVVAYLSYIYELVTTVWLYTLITNIVIYLVYI